MHRNTQRILVLGLSVVLTVTAVGFAVDSNAATSEERRAEREAEREARRLERETRRAEREAEREARRRAREEEDVREEEEEQQEESSCRCRAKLDFSRPQLQLRSGTLTFVPRVDISIRTRGDHTDPAWSASLSHEGIALYESEDVTVPSGTTFSGEQDIFHGQCGTDFDFDGYQLPAVPLAGITQSLVGEDEELEGRIGMKATLTSCETVSVAESFSFRLQDVLDLRVGNWRRIR